MEFTLLFILNLVLYKLGFWISLHPFTYISIIIVCFEIIILHNIYKNILTKKDIYVNLGFIISYISVYNNYEICNIMIFSLISDYIYDIIILKKTIKYLGSDLIKGTSGAAGLDIKSTKTIEIKPFEIVSIETNIKVEIPYGHFGFLTNRSSMAKRDILVLGGIIDSDYRGEIIVMLKNNSKTPYTVYNNDKIAQLICIKHLNIVEKVNKVSYTLRNTQCFGHTGR